MKQSKRIWLGILAILLAVAIVLGICWIIRAANTYTYSAEETREICQAHFLRTHLEGQALTTNVHSREFYKFTAGETTQRQVLKAVGDPHATTGSGFLYYVYFTSDRYLALVLYDSDDITLGYIALVDLQTGTRTVITS